MMADPESRHGGILRLGLLHALPWLLGLAIMRVWVGYAPWLYGDTMQGMLGHGLAWASGAPSSYNHVPMPFSTQLAGLSYMLTKPLYHTLASFHDTALALQILIVVATSAWFAWAGSRLNISAAAAAGVAMVGIGMPTLALTAVAFTGYFPVMAPLPAAAAILVVALLRGRVADAACRSALLVIGFGAANVYSLLPFAVAVLATVLVSGLGVASPPPHQRGWLVRLTTTTVVFLATHSLATGSITHLLPEQYAGKILRHAVYGLLPAAIATWVYDVLRQRYPLFAKADFLALTPMLSGWLVGANTWAPLWFLNAVYSLASRGTGQDMPLADGSFGLIQIGLLSAQIPWAILPLLSLLLGTWLLAGFIRVQPDQAGCAHVGFVIVVASLSVLALIGPMLALSDSVLSARYLVPLVPPVAMATAILLITSSTISRMTGAVFVACSVLSFAITIGPWATKNALQKAEARQIDEMIDQFLAEDAGNIVICQRNEAPERCGLLYGFENYRSERSKRALPAPTLSGGRIRYILPCANDPAGCEAAVQAVSARAPHILVISSSILINAYAGKVGPDCSRYQALTTWVCRF